MIHPYTELRFISSEKGYGVVATKLIPKGTITRIGDPLDQVFSPDAVNAFAPIFRDILYRYCFRDNKGDFILCWDNSRFVNHSFNSNCISTAYNFEIAIRDILPGDELTNDYGYLNITEPFSCPPEPGSDRTVVMPDDLLRYHPVWDNQVHQAFREFTKVRQPFLDLINPIYKPKVMEIASGSASPDSILSCYFPG